jgi:hypothetical protein
MLPAADAPASPAAAPMSPVAGRVAFRVVFVWAALACLPWPLALVPGGGRVVDVVRGPWDALVVAFGQHVLGIARPIVRIPGDSTFGWTQLGFEILIAAIAAAVWSAVSRRAAHPRLDAALRLYLRWFVAAAMLGYGVPKVFGLQFPHPTLARLAERVGDNSPMGLLWTFMGASLSYQVFCGAAEVLGGVLLLWRRTTTLGALIVAAAMANVVMLNLCYDVPAKIFSTQLLLTAVWLAAPDGVRLFDLLVRRRAPSAPTDAPPPWPSRWSGVVSAAGFVLLVLIIVQNVRIVVSIRQGATPASTLIGAWRVESATGVDWEHVVIGYYRETAIVRVRHPNDAEERIGADIDDAHRTLTLTTADGKRVMSWWVVDPDHLSLESAAMSLRLRRLPEPTWLLYSRGFHLVTEAPFNR